MQRIWKNDCRKKKQLLKEKKLCFRCCSDKHAIKDCKAYIKCKECGSLKHITALHIMKKQQQQSRENQNEVLKQGERMTSRQIVQSFVEIHPWANLAQRFSKLLCITKTFQMTKFKCMHWLTTKVTEHLQNHHSLITSSAAVLSQILNILYLHAAVALPQLDVLGEGFIIEGQDEKTHELPCITECSEI